MVEFHPNGLRAVKLVKKSHINWCPPKRSNVIAIDFGTSTIAVAYTIDGSGDVHEMDIQEEARDVYIPTVLLIRSDNTVEIGEAAILEYCMEACGVNECLFFERVKLELQNDQNVNKRSHVFGSDGRSYYLLEVIALILKKLKEEIKSFLELRGDYHVDSFDWVLTVPALWGERARDMMREAAYLAGLCSDQPQWEESLKLPLQPTFMHSPLTGTTLSAPMTLGNFLSLLLLSIRPNEDPPSIKELESTPERLSLVYEPDAAAAWCNRLNEHTVKSIGNVRPPVTTDEFFLTVDVGGGTIDVTGHQILEGGRMKRLRLPDGEIYGGTAVNQLFQAFLANEVVHDEKFSRFLSDDARTDRKADLLKVVYSSFEYAKKVFARSKLSPTKYFIVELPTSFAEEYEKELTALPSRPTSNADALFSKGGCQLKVSKEKMKSFFAPSITKISQCIDKTMEEVVGKHGDKLRIIYMVGGFGGCAYVAESIASKYGSDCLKVLVPKQHHLSVVKGACVYYDRNILETADATYGIETCASYDEHNPVHVNGSKIINDEGEELCENLFQPFVQVGEKFDADCVYLHSYTPVSRSLTKAVFPLYSTKEKYVNYTTGEDGKHLKLAAKVTLDISGAGDLPLSKRNIEFALDFNSIEIKIYARFENTGKRTSASIDFLTTKHKFDNILMNQL